MAAKVTFNPETRRIEIVESPTNGIIVLNVQTDLYSDGKEDWLADPVLNKMRFPIDAIGGQAISSGFLGTTYLLSSGWRLDPNLGSIRTIGESQVSSVALYGGSGTNEAVRQGFQLVHPGYVREGFVTVRTVGSPTDNLQLQILDSVGSVLEDVEIAGSLIAGSYAEVFFGSELETTADSGEQFYFVFTRTGSRDISNYFEFALDNDVYASGIAEDRDSGSWGASGGDIVMRYRSEVPYQLQIDGNIYTDTGVPVALTTGNVNVQQTVSTLVEVREIYEQALTDLRKLLLNAMETNPNTGVLTVFDDDGTTPLFTGDIWEDVAKTQKYRGQGIERRDALD